MSSLIHPADHSVAELKHVLEDVDDVETLERLVDARADQRLERVANEPGDAKTDESGDAKTDEPGDAKTGESDETRVGESGDNRTDEGVVADENTDEHTADQQPDDTAIIEEGWSKDTVVSLGHPSTTEGRTETPADARQSDRLSELEGVTANTSDRTPTRAEAASLSTTATGVDEEVGEQLLENIERIRYTFENSAAEGGRVEARIRQLQTEVGDLKAYTSALEEFLNEEGTGRQVIESVRGDIDSLEAALTDVGNDVRIHGRNLEALWDVVEDAENELSRLHELLHRTGQDVTSVAADVEAVEDALEETRTVTDSRLEEHADTLEGVDETLSAHGETLSNHDESLDGLEEEVAAVADAVDTVETQVDATADEVRELGVQVDERFDDNAEVREELTARIADNADAVDAVGAKVDDLTSRIESVEALVDDAGHVDSRFGTVEAELEELHEWREQLSSVLLSSTGAEPKSTES